MRRRSRLQVHDPVLPPLVLLHGLLAVELLLADVALERTVVAVRSLVDPEVALLRVLLAAHLARERLLAGVGDEVALHGGHADEALAAHAAHGQDLGRLLLVAT